MCDYSLFAVPNRLAEEQEDLVAHRFPTGSMGLASPADLRRDLHSPAGPTFWARIRQWFLPVASKPVPAVCIPPGARLKLSRVPVTLQQQCSVSDSEEVTFTQLSASSYAYRDAIRFENGKTVLLQDLPEGLTVRVLSLATVDPEWEPFREELHARLR
jgi:hypothetical protein